METLWDAVFLENIIRVKELLKDPTIDVNFKGDWGRTCFAVACEQGNVEIVNGLLADRRTDFYTLDWGSYSALDLAFIHRKDEIFWLLVGSPRIDLARMGWKQIHVDFARGDVETARDWIRQFERGRMVDMNIRTSYAGFTPFFIATHLEHLEVIKLMLGQPKIDINQPTIEAETPLFIACKKRSLEVIRLLLKDGRIEPNKANMTEITPLVDSCFYGRLEVVRLLLEGDKVDINKPGPFNQTPFHSACYAGHIQLVKLFLDCNRPVAVNKKMDDGTTPLCTACVRSYHGIVDLLLNDQRIEVNHVDGDNCTELWSAADNGSIRIVKRLLASNYDIDLKKRSNQIYGNGKTSVEVARWKGYHHIADLIGEYERDKIKVRGTLRKELRLNVHDAARLLSLVVLFCDGYLQLQPKMKIDRRKKKLNELIRKAMRFFPIVSRFPLELQSRICNLAFDHDSFLINSKTFEPALKSIIRLIYKPTL